MQAIRGLWYYRHDMTSPDVTYLRIEWKVKNIFSVPKQESEQFRFQTSLCKFVLEKVTTESTERLQVHLEETKWKNVLDHFVSRVFIVDENRTPQFLLEKVFKETYINIQHICHHDCVWSIDAEDLRRKEGILSTGGVVTFVCILMSKTTSEGEDTEGKGVQPCMNAASEASAESLAVDFRRLLDDGTQADVTLKSGDVTIPAHKLILSARSEVFAAMLRSDMEESRRGVVEISDTDPPVLRQLVQFIYSGRLSDLTMKTAPQLFAAGDKYAIEALKRQCSAFMKDNLAEVDACSILVLADAHSDRDLRECAISYIMDTGLTQNDDVWPRFCDDHPKLAIEVLNRVCKATKSLKQ